MAQRNAVTHDLVFDRILQRGILDYFDDFTPDEANTLVISPTSEVFNAERRRCRTGTLSSDVGWFCIYNETTYKDINILLGFGSLFRRKWNALPLF